MHQFKDFQNQKSDYKPTPRSALPFSKDSTCVRTKMLCRASNYIVVKQRTRDKCPLNAASLSGHNRIRSLLFLGHQQLHRAVGKQVNKSRGNLSPHIRRLYKCHHHQIRSSGLTRKAQTWRHAIATSVGPMMIMMVNVNRRWCCAYGLFVFTFCDEAQQWVHFMRF